MGLNVSVGLYSPDQDIIYATDGEVVVLLTGGMLVNVDAGVGVILLLDEAVSVFWVLFCVYIL